MMKHHGLGVCVGAALICLGGVPLRAQEFARPQTAPPGTVAIADQIELARLVDIAAQRVKVNIEYDAAALKGMVTLRLGAGVSDEELWDLTNRLLASRGFTTVKPPGRDGVLSVVKLETAGGLSKITGPGDVLAAGPTAGFGAVVYQLKHRTAKDVTETVKHVLSKPAGNAVAVGDKLLLITDLTPRIEQTISFLETIDVPGAPVEVLEVPTTHLTGSQLSILAAQVVAKRDLVAGDKVVGEVLPGPDGRSVLVIAPKEVQGFWRGMLAALDKREPLETRNYIPRYFELKEVQRIIEETLRSTSARASGEGAADLRVVADDLTGTLIITATVTQHDQIGDIVDRYNAIPPEGRRPMRTFKVRNRAVSEVLTVLEALVASGDFAGDLTEGTSLTSPAPGSNAASPATTNPPSPAGVSGTQPDPTPNPSRAGATETVSRNESRRRGTSVSGGDRTKTQFGRGGGSEPQVVLTLDEGTSSIIAMGEPRVLTQIEKLIQQLDVRQPQVMVQALVVSLSDSQTQQFGIELEGQINLSGDSILRLSSLFGLSSAGAQVGERVSSGAGGTGLLLSPGEFAVVIRALETINKGRSVSMPQVLVNNNQQASFNSTVEQPYATIINGGSDEPQTTFGGSTSAGTVVTAKPQIGEGDHLILDYTVELSAFVGEAQADLPPPKQTNNVASAVTLPDGYTVAVGGLELTTDSNSVEQIPLLSQIPLIGEAFKNRSKTTNRSRFFVFLRAEVMRHERFEDLKYTSQLEARKARIDDGGGWPKLQPRVIR